MAWYQKFIQNKLQHLNGSFLLTHADKLKKKQLKKYSSKH